MAEAPFVLVSMPAIIYWAIPIFFVSLTLEYLWARHQARESAGGRSIKGYENSDMFASLAMGIGNLVVTLGTKALGLALLFFAYQFHVFDLSADLWWAWPLLLIGDDFCYYWFHRFGHRMRIGWAGHVNHHSSEYYNLSTALRQSWTSPLFKDVFYLPLAFIGFHPLMILTMQGVSLLYQFWIHTEAINRMPRWFEAVMNTPSHHRVHHGANTEYVDRNYGGFFIVFDKWFGTFQAEQAPVYYGLRKSFTSRNPFWIAFHEWAALLKHVWAAKHWKNKFLYFVMPPAWDPKEADEPKLHLSSGTE